MLQSYPDLGILAPSNLPMITESLGKGGIDGGNIANPVLVLLERQRPYLLLQGAGRQRQRLPSGWVCLTAPRWSTPMARPTHRDGHAKHKTLSINVVSPGLTNPGQIRALVAI